jgi:arsenite-transporting ATPase
MLGIPEILNFYFARIFPIQRKVVRTMRPVAQRMTDMPIPSDEVFGAVKSLYQQLEGMGPLLQDPRRSSIRIVLNPEKMVISESQRLYTYLNLFGFPVDAIIANRVLPDQARSPYFDRWFGIQAGTSRRPVRPSTPSPSSRPPSSTVKWWARPSSTSLPEACSGTSTPRPFSTRSGRWR